MVGYNFPNIKLLRKFNYWTNNRPPTAECIDKTSDINASFGVTISKGLLISGGN